MTEQMRRELTPQGFIRELFNETRNGKVTFSYVNPDNDFAEEEKTLELNWLAEDAENIEAKYTMLTDALARIAKVHDQLDNEEKGMKLLTPLDLEVWNTYVRPYDEFEYDMSVINEIIERMDGDLFEEEEEIWKKFCIWREEQSQKRIPFNRRSSANMILRAARYEKLLSLNAPEIIVTEEGKFLAEEMVLYYFGKEEPIAWD